MQVKKFEATTIQEALESVKRELGPEAIILKTKRNKAGFGLLSGASVEVTAAIPDKVLQKKKTVESRLTEKSKNEISQLSAAKQSKIYDQVIEKTLLKSAINIQDKVSLSAKKYADIDDEKKSTPALSADSFFGKIPFFQKSDNVKAQLEVKSEQSVSLEKEVEKLKSLIYDIQQNQITVKEATKVDSQSSRAVVSSAVMQDFYDQLIINGVDQKFAFSLIKKTEELLSVQDRSNPEKILEELALSIIDTTEVVELLDGIITETNDEPVKIALVGPTGVGKTTSIAKIAGEAILKRKLKVGVINLDFQKAGAYEQLKTYSQIFNLPFHSVKNEKELKNAIEDLSSMDLILIDTAGYSQSDDESIINLKHILDTVQNIRTHLVLSSTTRDLELYSIGKKFSSLHPDGVIFSKLDESLSYGILYNVSQRLKLPVIYFTHGQKVPDDIEIATKEKMASLVLDL